MAPLIDSTGFDQQKLLSAINAEITACRATIPVDQAEKDRRTRELQALTTHLLWAQRVDNNQVELELIVRALERLRDRGIFRSNRNWRESAGA